jgi:dCTP deaminase
VGGQAAHAARTAACAGPRCRYDAPMTGPADPPAGRILVDRDLAALCGTAIQARAPIEPSQIQPASIDLRVGTAATRVRAGFLPERGTVAERVRELELAQLSLADGGAVLEPGAVYLVPLAERLALPPELHGRFNPRSSAGRCDVFTRVLVPGHTRFDETPRGYAGELWLEVAPLSFPLRLRAGERLCQMRVQRGVAALSPAELRARYAEEPLCFDGARPLDPREVRFDDDGGLLLGIGLAGRDPCGWRARDRGEPLDLATPGAHALADFWEPVHAPNARCVLEPGRFTLFASRERIRVPPDLAAEMLPIDVGIGEMRNNYAGFFDSGFGWETLPGREVRGTPAVLEVRAHDVPFEVEDGQAFFRLRFFRVHGRPERLYGEGREAESYRDQDLTPARCFR